MQRGGIVGRGVLLDYARWADEHNVALHALQTQAIAASTLQEVARAQNVTLRTGDILLVRTGWTRAYGAATAAAAAEGATDEADKPGYTTGGGDRVERGNAALAVGHGLCGGGGRRTEFRGVAVPERGVLAARVAAGGVGDADWRAV